MCFILLFLILNINKEIMGSTKDNMTPIIDTPPPISEIPPRKKAKPQ